MHSFSLHVIRCALWGGEAPVVNDWEAVFADLRKHCLTNLAYKHAAKSDISTALYKAWDRDHVFHLTEYVRMLAMQEELTDLFNRHGISHAIVKGLAAGRYYPEPAERIYGDIDILIPDEEAFGRAEKLLLENNFILVPGNGSPNKDHEDDRHHAYTKNQVHFEVHRYFSAGIDETDRELDQILGSVTPVTAQVEDHKFNVLPEPYNGITILEHIRHHMITGIGFRQIIDWCCYVDKILTDEYWQSDFEQLANCLSLRPLAVYLTRLCELNFGLRHRAFAEEADEQICADLFKEIDTAGNFGMTRNYGDFEVRSAVVNGHIFSHLQKNGENKWPALKKHKWLRPFAWLWEGCRVFFSLLSRGQLLRTLAGLFRHKANKQKSTGPDMWEVLGIGKYRKAE